MRKLADDAGVALKTLYNQYGGRAAILRALVSETMDRMDEAFEAAAPLHSDPIEYCRAVVTVSIDLLERDKALTRALVLSQYQGLEGGPSDDGGVTSRPAQMQAVALREAVEQGYLRDELDPDLLGSLIYQCYRMAFVLWAFDQIDRTTFEARALYGLHVVLASVATPKLEPRLSTELARLEALLRERPETLRNRQGEEINATR